MSKTKTNLSGKFFGTLSKKDINSNQAGYISLNDFMSRWQSSMNKPVFENKNVGDLVYEAFK